MYLCALCCFFTMLYSTASHCTPSQNDLDLIHRQLSALHQQQQTTANNRNQAADALRKSEIAISTTNRTLYELQQRDAQTQSQLSALNQQIADTHHSTTRQQQKLAHLLRQFYENQVPDNALQAWLQGVPPDHISRNLTYTTHINRERMQLITHLQYNANVLDQLKQQQQQLQLQLDQQRAQQEQQHQQLQTEKKQRQQVLNQLGKQQQHQQQQISNLEQNEKRITQLMQALARVAALAERKRHHAQVRHFTPNKRTPIQQPSETAFPTPELPSSGLGLLKGLLPMPTHGELIHRFGTPREAGGTLWKGLFIKAPSGQSVISVAAGQVVFADWLRGFGNLIIVDHGGGYMSLYSDNETLYKRVGDSVKAAEAIAAVGNTGGNKETGLYFELRYRSQAFDPDKWLAH